MTCTEGLEHFAGLPVVWFDAEALLAGRPLTHLRKLDPHHHFLSEAMTARVRAALPDVEVSE